MNTIKSMIQKEEYIALAVNKYILQTGTIPKVKVGEDYILDWNKLEIEDYLGASFNKINPFSKTEIKTLFNDKNELFISGAIQSDTQYSNNDKYLYNFYTNKLFRINTIPPESILLDTLKKGSQVKYEEIVKQIVNLRTNSELIFLDSQKCTVNNYFYELKNKELIYKYCKNSDGDSIQIFQKAPIYVEDFNDLLYIKANIGDKAYALSNNNWFEYYYQGDVANRWVPTESGSILHSQDEDEDIADRIISYIPNAKDLVLRSDGGCMLANGDIFCWGNNSNKKAGIESYGQLNPNFSPNFINTPVMLKVQIDDEYKIYDSDLSAEVSRRYKKWYNNPYRVKFEKMAVNNNMVCGTSPIFDYFQLGEFFKFGGDLYCNGALNSTYFEDINDIDNVSVTTSILKRNKFFQTGKTNKKNDGNEIYLEDVVMVDDAVAVLSESGDIYTFGTNTKGALGINNTDETVLKDIPVKINETGQIFEKIYALRGMKTFGALDENNKFWIWGERPNGNIFYKPTALENNLSFNEEAIFVNSKEFILKGFDKKFYVTSDETSSVIAKEITDISIPTDALSVTTYSQGDSNYYLYIDKDRHLKGSDKYLTCQYRNYLCSSDSNKELFTKMIDEFNSSSSEEGQYSNVSIFEIKNVDFVLYETFESTPIGWNDTTTFDTGSTNILGRYGKNKLLSSGLTMTANGSEEIYKTFDFGVTNANKQVDISFVMYEIDSWDANYYSGDGGITESFIVYLNGSEYTRDVYRVDSSGAGDTRGGTSLYIPGTSSHIDEKHSYSFSTTLDSNGKVKLGFGAILGEDWTNESFAVDNVKLTIKDSQNSFVCSMTGTGSSSQMYCWGEVGRSLPILSTSLYDVSKISNINKLFITQNSELSNQMSFDEFNNNGNLFLKFPTYIGGFDYEFYFK